MTHVTAGPIEFSTVGLPDQERIELWEDHNADALIGLRCRTLEASQLEATETNVQLDSIGLARVVGTSHVVERDADLIRRRPSDSVVMYFSLVGEAFFYSEDGVRTVRPGQLLLCDADKAFMRGFSRGLEELVIKMPRSIFDEVAGARSLTDPMVFDFGKRGNAHAAALARHVNRATRPHNLVPPDEQTILELVSVLASGARDDLNTAHRAAAKAFIEGRIADPTLSATRVADAIGISARHLSRVFAADGISVPRYILARRLDVARALLEKPAAASMTIAEIAHHCGFASATHFSNAFVLRFSERASDVRRDATAARAASGPS
ncbi:helix-turn-helix domain-containing protein [Aeromicrobium yanjiei]|uniref:Helix-turn-helix domain-containing protein n=1 Tax=Aeromicrobium yanjiei TaxID=2662028 RepID=A0A5Q2MHV7_9ACTN|nr:helix-turn-helix domain-containing protein [Aeromicrobium yanjiei]QGG42674.1 helix-turn-helix domain-containing protein [Aeromicrobium yanjiei]